MGGHMRGDDKGNNKNMNFTKMLIANLLIEAHRRGERTRFLGRGWCASFRECAFIWLRTFLSVLKL